MKYNFTYIILLMYAFSFGQLKTLDSLRTGLSNREHIEKTPLTGDTLKVENFNKKANHFLYRDMDSARYYAVKGVTLADQLGYEEGQIKSRYYLSLIYLETGRKDQSLQLQEESLSIAEGFKNMELIMVSYNNLGSFYKESGDIKTSIEHLKKSILLGNQHLKKLRKDSEEYFSILKQLSLTNEFIASNYAALDQNYMALDYLNIADELNQEIGDDLSTAQTLVNKGELLFKLDRYEDALINIRESMETLDEYDSKDWKAFAERLIGDIYLEQGHARLGLEAYREAEALQLELDDKREQANLESAMAKALLSTGKSGAARSYARAALDKAMLLGELKITAESAETLFHIYEQRGEPSSALYYHKIFKKYNDSLFNETNVKSLANLQTQLENQKLNAEREKKNQQELNKKNMLIFLSTGGVFILLAVLFLSQRSRKLERKLNDLLSKKNRVLRRRELQLKWLNETKNKLFSIISHDLRSPISSLNGLIDLLNDKQIGPEDFIDYAPQLSEQVKNVSFTLNNLLMWSRHQMKGAHNNPKQYKLASLSSQSVTLLTHQAKQKQITIINEIPKEAEIYADGDQVTIVFRNLLSNAIKFTENDGLIFLYAREKEGAWEVEIKDTGIGMDQLTIERILTRSSYMESTYGTNNEKGTGIGLSLCKEMITRSGGEFWIKSAIGVGSSFFFTLEKYEEEVQKVLEPSETVV